MTEKQLQTAIVECAPLLGWRVYHTHDSRRSAPGFPDLVLLRRRRLICAELKSSRGTVAQAQHEWLHAFAAASADTFVWRPVHWLDGTIELELRQEFPVGDRISMVEMVLR